MTEAYYNLLKAKEVVTLIEESLAQVEAQLKDECTEKAYLNRAVLQQNKLSLTQAKTKIEIAEAADGSELLLNGNYNLRDIDFLPENESWKASIVLNIPFYDGGSSKAEVEKAESNLKQLESRRWQLKESISLEVKEAYLDTRSAQERIEVARNSIEQAKKNLEIKEARYKEGVTTSTKVIDAEVALTTAKTNYLEAKYDYQIAAAQLIRVMGFKRGRWHEEI